jgi:hypothetical protein
MIVVTPPNEVSSTSVGGESIRFVSVGVIDSSSVKHFHRRLFHLGPDKTTETV